MVAEPEPDVRQTNETTFTVDSLWVVPSETDAPIVHENIYEQLSSERSPVRAPLLITTDGLDYYLRLHPKRTVQTGTIELPYHVTKELDVDRLPNRVEFEMATVEHARNLYRINGTDITAIEG